MVSVSSATESKHPLPIALLVITAKNRSTKERTDHNLNDGLFLMQYTCTTFPITTKTYSHGQVVVSVLLFWFESIGCLSLFLNF